MNSVISFVIVLGLLIFVHELGHFLCAKLFGVKVLKFSLGFGPRLVGARYRDTEYQISAFPLGGYVKMLGENPAEEVDSTEEDQAFSKKSVWKRFFIVASGPVFNLLFAVFLFFMIFAIAGLPHPVEGTRIGGISKDSPAAAANLQSGDRIVSINGKETTKWEDVYTLVGQSDGETITIVVERNGQTFEKTLTPALTPEKNIFGEKVGERYMLGISRSEEVVYKDTSIYKALIAGITQTWTFIYLTIIGIVKMIQSVIPASELGGPILIAQMAGQQMEAGWINLFYFIGLISVNLGILNLFPIPILDGGHLFFYCIEAVRGKPLSRRAQEIWMQFGLVILLSLMVFVFYNDLVRVFKG